MAYGIDRAHAHTQRAVNQVARQLGWGSGWDQWLSRMSNYQADSADLEAAQVLVSQLQGTYAQGAAQNLVYALEKELNAVASQWTHTGGRYGGYQYAGYQYGGWANRDYDYDYDYGYNYNNYNYGWNGALSDGEKVGLGLVAAGGVAMVVDAIVNG